MYQPTKNLYEAIQNWRRLQLFPWDEYFMTMAEADFQSGRADVIGVKSFFIRQAPFGGSYALLGGITDALRTINEFDFADADFIAGLRDLGYGSEFINWLQREEHLKIKIYTGQEGQVFFENEPIISVEGPLPFVRLAEGIITEAVNFPSLSLTKWNRLVRVVRPGQVMEFARRRAQYADRVTLYAALAGCTSSSNTEMRRFIDIRISGTMGHEWVQGFGDVREAFRVWLDNKPGKVIGLIDTKQCLEHDFPIWLDEVWNHREAIKNVGPVIWGWRNDSGDLAYLTIEQYRRFKQHELARDEWFWERMRIVLTNDLDEYSAESIIAQIYTQAKAAGLDAEDIIRRIIWAAGTKPGTCYDQPSIGGVAKLMEVEGFQCIKLAFDADGLPGFKTSIPGFNFSYQIYDQNGEFQFVLLAPANRYSCVGGQLFYTNDPISEIIGVHPNNEGMTLTVKNYQAIPQQQLLYDSYKGRGFTEKWFAPMIDNIPGQIQQNLDRLGWRFTRLDKPEKPKVLLTPDLFALRQKMIKQGVLRADKLR